MFLSSANSSAVDFEQNTERISLGKRFVPARPFIKWAGGKRRLLEQYSPFLPSISQFNHYFEPFLGGGAVFFHLRTPKALLADLNADLINCYRMVRDNPEELIDALSKHKTSEQYFYKIRELVPETLSPLDRASRFIYLNKTCYNGLYRVNKQGQFNVPYGRYKKPLICDTEVIKAASQALKNIQLTVSSFEKTVEKAQKRDFIYLDPPYVPLSPTASFTSYTSTNFTEQDQLRLSLLVRELDKKGCLVMLSNSDTKLVRDLYQGLSIITVQCPRSINSNPFARGTVTELLIKNY
jgi:DNA adenine methylase